MLDLIKEYSELPIWRDYISRTVYLGHPAYIRDLMSPLPDQVADLNLSLLRSVAGRDSSFVKTVLQHLLAKNPEEGRRLFTALPYDCTEDNEELFRFRIKLLETNLDLIDKSFVFYYCINKQSPRAVDYLKLALKTWNNGMFSGCHLGEQDDLTQYAKRHYLQIKDCIFPLICNLTQHYQPCWPNKHEFGSPYKDWIASFHNPTFYRKTVLLTSMALKVFAEVDGEGFCSLLSSLQYPFSGIGHEIVMEGLLSLSTEYSDYAISWLLSDFKEKVFVFSSDKHDYLYYTKTLICKFSPNCSKALFEKLERVVCNWNDNKKYVKHVLECRLDSVRNNAGFRSEYYPFWGHLQKNLLPCLDQERISNYARNLLGVLERNPWIRVPSYTNFLFGNGAKAVVSPVDFYANRLSDRIWLQIISTPIEKMKRRFHGSDVGAYYIEATHETFSRAFGTQAQKYPARFAELSLSFPEECFPGYIVNVLNALASSHCDENPVPMDLIARVIRRYWHFNSYSIRREIMWILQSNPDYDWPTDIISFVSDCAIHDIQLSADNLYESNPKEFDNGSLSWLQSTSQFSTRGSALNAIAQLLWNHNEFSDIFRNTIE